MGRPRRTLRGLPAELTVRQAARLLRLPEPAIWQAIAAGELTTVGGPGGLVVDTRTLLTELGVPAELIDRLARRWPDHRTSARSEDPR